MTFTQELIEEWREEVKADSKVGAIFTKDAEKILLALDEIERLQARVQELEKENSRLSVLLHDEMNQLELTIDLSNKRWIALNNIYTDGEKHNANWCKRKAQEGLGIK
jgi:hypothetical protein